MHGRTCARGGDRGGLWGSGGGIVARGKLIRSRSSGGGGGGTRGGLVDLAPRFGAQ